MSRSATTTTSTSPTERAGRAELGERAGLVGGPERSELDERPERPELGERPERVERTERPERVELDDGVGLQTWAVGAPESGRLPAVLLHGGPGLWDYLAPVAAMLVDLTVVHRFDQRGCGRSDPSDDQRVARLVADVEALRRHWGHERLAVVGHSFGATLALAYAWTHPGRVGAVGYVSGTGLGDWGPAYRAERRRRMSAAEVARWEQLRATAARSPDEELEYRVLSWFTDHGDASQARRWAAEDAAAPHHVNWAANRALGAETAGWTEQQVRASCRRIQAPVLLLHGTEDPRPVSQVRALAAALPRARLHLVDGAGHDPWRERPAEVRDHLRELVTGRTGEPHVPGERRAQGAG